MNNRITGRLEDGTIFVRSETGNEGTGHFTTQRRLPEILNKLAAYEDAEEQGRIIVPPCKVGDTVYLPFADEKVRECVVDRVRVSIDVCGPGYILRYSSDRFPYYCKPTREEAEQALREVYGDA